MRHIPNDAFVEHLKRRCLTANVPEHLRDGLVQYCAARRPMGQFLTAVVKNDLRDAVMRAADDSTRRGLHAIITFLYNYCTDECWGSPEKVEMWLDSDEPVPENYD